METGYQKERCLYCKRKTLLILNKLPLKQRWKGTWKNQLTLQCTGCEKLQMVLK